MVPKSKETWHQHRNPDGSVGGWIPSSADIDPSAYVGPSALINPGAKLGPGGRVSDGQMLTADGSILSIGKS